MNIIKDHKSALGLPLTCTGPEACQPNSNTNNNNRIYTNDFIYYIYVYNVIHTPGVYIYFFLQYFGIVSWQSLAGRSP